MDVAQRPFRPNEVSSGGVLVRPAGADHPDHEVCLVSDGRYWGLPKGIVEPGESPEQAALREIAEETGIPQADLSVRAPLPVSEYVYRARDGRLIFKRVHHFLVDAPAGAELHPDAAEIAEAGWFDFTAAKARASFKNTGIAIDAAATLLNRGAIGSPT